MDITLHLKAVLLGIVEGLTEFLPVSSTGHLIIAGDWLEFNTGKEASFEIFIQLGAILSVCWFYRGRLLALLRELGRSPPANAFALNLGIAFLPAAAVGFFTHGYIKQHLFTPEVVAWALIGGGIAILLIEQLVKTPRTLEANTITPRQAFGIGCAQVLALIPGVSRSGATIMGGMVSGLDRRAATEFSFFLAIPMMFAATCYDLAKSWRSLAMEDLGVFAVGFVTAFISALLTIRFLLHFVSRHSFAWFAWYRILFGSALLWYYAH
ncbi:MAG: undecaprenyl-diphosphate phosphatase [Gammaproteobacteria bacterium]|nr:undecaprenyl-diphosphate phosphatase [Gammaproteobacteria bacterium]